MPPTALSGNWDTLSKTLVSTRAPKRKTAAEEDDDIRRSFGRSDPEPASKRAKSASSASRYLPPLHLPLQTLPNPAISTTTPAPPTKPQSRARATKMAELSAAAADNTPAAPATTISATLALWAEDNDIPAHDLALAYGLPLTTTELPTETAPAGTTNPTPAALDAAENGKTDAGKYIAMDCEMVGIGETGSALARVSIVNFHGHCVLNMFVKPKEKVTDWRTWVSGVRQSDMANALTFEEAQVKVAELMKDRILVGHAIKNDLEVLLIGHARRDIRDTSRYPPFRKMAGGKTPGLKKLAKLVLGIEIQGGQHSSVSFRGASLRRTDLCVD